MKDIEQLSSNEHVLSPLEKQRREALELCEGLRQNFKERAKRHKWFFYLLRFSSIVLAIAVTVISTLTVIQGISLWVVPLVSGFSTLCTTLVSVTNSQERWVHSRGVQQQLEAERFLFMQHAGGYATTDEEANICLFSERLVAIWSEGHQGWAQRVSKVSSEPSPNTLK